MPKKLRQLMSNTYRTEDFMPKIDQRPVHWAISPKPIDYQTSVFLMEERVRKVATGALPELVWLLEHPPIYTAGTSAVASDLLAPTRFPVYKTGRGGELTYHGPGQRVVYVMLDVRQRFGSNVRGYVEALERWGVDTLAAFGVAGKIRKGRVGIWVEHPDLTPGGEAKIAALGIRIRNGISFHGLSINIDPELEHFSGIVPCGIREFGVTSLRALGLAVTMKDVDNVLRSTFEAAFSPTVGAEAPCRTTDAAILGAIPVASETSHP
jgi:lipoyl(octanoyl) transferase